MLVSVLNSIIHFKRFIEKQVFTENEVEAKITHILF